MQANSGGAGNNNPGDKKDTNKGTTKSEGYSNESKERNSDAKKDQNANPNESQNNNNTAAPNPSSQGNNQQATSNGTTSNGNVSQNGAQGDTKEPRPPSKTKQMILAASKKEKELQETEKEKLSAGQMDKNNPKQTTNGTVNPQAASGTTKPGSGTTSRAKQALLAAAKAQREQEAKEQLAVNPSAPPPLPPKSDQIEPPPIPPRAGSAGKGLLPAKAKQMVQAATVAQAGKMGSKQQSDEEKGDSAPPLPPPRPPSKDHQVKKTEKETPKTTQSKPLTGDKDHSAQDKEKLHQSNQGHDSVSTKKQSPKPVKRSSSTGRGDSKPSSRPSSFRTQSSVSSGGGGTRPQTGKSDKPLGAGSKSPKFPRPASNQHNLQPGGTKAPSKDSKDPKSKTKETGTKGSPSETEKDGKLDNKPGVLQNPAQKPADTKDESNPDGENKPAQPSRRILMLASKGEWSVLEQTLRTMDKVNNIAEVSVNDPDTSITPLMLAVRENRLVIAERLIELGAPINDQAKDGRSALHYAAAFSRDDIVKLLINKKADATLLGGPKEQLALSMACARNNGAVTSVQMLLRASNKEARLTMDKDGSIPLFLAAEAGNTSICRELLQMYEEHQINVHKFDNGDTVLHIACRRKDFESAKLFVEHSADVDAKNNEGQTPLHIAAWEGDDSLIKYLQSCKANPNIIDKMDRSPLHIAAERGHTGVVELLVDKFKANVSARTKDGSTLMHISSQFGHPDTALTFLKKGVPLLMPNKSGAICLHAAAMKGHTSVIRALLQKGAPVDAVTKDSYTALHIAVEHCKPLAVQTLLGFGAKVELKGGKAQETPLHIAARIKEGEKCAEMLVKSGADVNATKENGETALHIAARYGQQKMVTALLAEGADPTWQSKSGETPLHVSIRYCHWEVADELLRFIAKSKSTLDAIILVNIQNGEGETAVHHASELTKTQAHHEFEDTDMIKLLLEFEGDTNVQTRLTSETPIHYCARAGNADVLLEIVRYLGPNRVQGAINKQARNGWSPLLVASENGHLGILKILLQHHARVDVFDEHGKAALHLAAENGHGLVADLLLVHKAFVNAKSKLGLTPLHLASQNGYNKLVKLLIEKHGATIDALSLAKKTPLHLAAQNGMIEVCSTLLTIKADANATDVHGQTPLHLAAENDHSDVVKLFLKHRPELVTMANVNGMTCAHIAASKGSVAVIKELMRFNKITVTTARNKSSDSTTLHLAAAGGHAPVVKYLLEAGASATDENAEGNTAIHLAAKHGHTQVLGALKDHVAWTVTSTKTGLTALHVAAHYGQMEFVRDMLSKVPATIRSEPPHSSDGPLRDIGGESGLTPLHLAAQSGHEGLVRMLLNSPGVLADAATNVQGVIPLHLAAQSGHTAVVSLLLSKSTSQLKCTDKRGRTGLHLAASNGHLDMVSLLLSQGTDINCFDKNGMTTLHYAAKAGHLHVVKHLIEAGAHTEYETKDGKIPLFYATSNSHYDVLSYLLTKEHDTQMLMDDKKFLFDIMAMGKTNSNRSIQEYILVSPAPVDTAVKMSRAFTLLAAKEKERAKDIMAASVFCEEMATELNAIAANMHGPAVLLKAVDERGIPFLDVLIECEQKEVVSHPSVQRYLSDVWTGHLSHWSGWMMILLFCVLLFVPPVWLAFSIPNKQIRFNKVPVIKFMSYLVSHIYLIVLYTLTIVYPVYPIFESGDLIPHWYEWLLLSWLSGLLVSQLTNPEDRSGLGIIKVIVIAISAVAVLTHLIAFAYQGDDRLNCIYARNQFMGFALLLCFVQLLDFLSFHHLFGPWAIIIRDLMKDLMRFLVILTLFMLGFTLQLAAIYLPVTAPVVLDQDNGDGDGSGGQQLEDPFSTFELLFFALFGLVDPENLPPINRNPIWSITLAKCVFGIYLIITIVVLINLLIAMMSDTYQRIQAQSDTEWKFGRAKLFRNMNKTSATPSPLNLFTKCYIYIRILCKHRSKVCTMTAQQYVDEEEDLDDAAESRSMDLLTGRGHGGESNVAWLRNVVRRNTQVAPDEDFLRAAKGGGPSLLKDVVNWKAVVDKYLQLIGQSDGTGDGDLDDEDDEDGGEVAVAAPAEGV